MIRKFDCKKNVIRCLNMAQEGSGPQISKVGPATEMGPTSLFLKFSTKKVLKYMKKYIMIHSKSIKSTKIDEKYIMIHSK
jgi:hypothetical protein